MSKKNNFQSLKQIAKKLVLDYRTLLSLIDCHPDLVEALKPYRYADNPRANKRYLPPTVVHLIYSRFQIED